MPDADGDDGGAGGGGRAAPHPADARARDALHAAGRVETPRLRLPAAAGAAGAAGAAAAGGRPPPPPPRTKWTRRVPHPVLIGHAASLTRTDGGRAARLELHAAPPREVDATAALVGALGSPGAAAQVPSPLPPVLTGHVSSLLPY